MDVGAFSDEKFDAKDWINKSFKSSEALENKEAFVASIVMKLQLYVQQVNSALEDSCDQVLQNMPRIKRDAEVLQQEVLLLQEKMDSLKIDIAKIESDTGKSMATLEHIDRIKTSLQVAKQALHEADNWSILANDLEEVFESHKVDLISKKIVAMQQSLTILANVPDYEDRKLQLEGLKNRLEAMTSPKLVQAFTSGSIDQAKYYIKIFTEIDRMPQLLKYYHKCQKGILLQQWIQCVEADQDDGILDWMKKFYDIMLTKWNDQVKWTVQVLSGTSRTLDVLLDLHRDVLASLEPSLTLCLDEKLKQQGVEPLKLLGEAKLSTSRYAKNLKTAIHSSKSNYGKSFSKEKAAQLAETIYAPYVNYIIRYEMLEEQTLSKQMSTLIRTHGANSNDLMEGVHILGNSISRTIQALVEANKRCLSFTEGCAYPAFINASKTFLTNYFEHWRLMQRKIDQQKREHEDWHLFQTSLTFLQYLGELTIELRQLDSDLSKSLLETARRLNESDNVEDPFNQFRRLLLTLEDRRKLENLLSDVQGDTCILESSITMLSRLCSDLHHSLYLLLLAPVYRQLDQVQSAPAWQLPGHSQQPPKTALAADLPDFSYSPHEYITLIGQYLMTLPQHLEPFLLQENPSLTVALQSADSAYANAQQAAGADVLLSIVAKGTCQAYLDHVLGIYELSGSACKQLATDIDYLGNVLDDLGLSLSEHLRNVSTLLRIPSDQYQSRSAGCAPRLVAAVRQMRNITST